MEEKPTAQLQDSIKRKTVLNLHPLKSIKNWGVNWSILLLGNDLGENIEEDSAA